MASNILKRDGSWVVELMVPLRHGGKEIADLVIKPATMEHDVRWGRGDIPSILALLAELTELPERLLRTIPHPDVDRVMLAFSTMMPPNIQADCVGGKFPLATPDKDLPPADVVDQQNPLFPHVDGPVRRFPTAPPPAAKPLPKDDGSGFDLNPPETTRAVG